MSVEQVGQKLGGQFSGDYRKQTGARLKRKVGSTQRLAKLAGHGTKLRRVDDGDEQRMVAIVGAEPEGGDSAAVGSMAASLPGGVRDAQSREEVLLCTNYEQNVLTPCTDTLDACSNIFTWWIRRLASCSYTHAHNAALIDSLQGGNNGGGVLSALFELFVILSNFCDKHFNPEGLVAAVAAHAVDDYSLLCEATMVEDEWLEQAFYARYVFIVDCRGIDMVYAACRDLFVFGIEVYLPHHLHQAGMKEGLHSKFSINGGFQVRVAYNMRLKLRQKRKLTQACIAIARVCVRADIGDDADWSVFRADLRGVAWLKATKEVVVTHAALYSALKGEELDGEGADASETYEEKSSSRRSMLNSSTELLQRWLVQLQALTPANHAALRRASVLKRTNAVAARKRKADAAAARAMVLVDADAAPQAD